MSVFRHLVLTHLIVKTYLAIMPVRLVCPKTDFFHTTKEQIVAG